MPLKFTNEEYADIHFIYGFCNGNARAAVEEYRRRFPRCNPLPNRQVFIDIHRRLRETGCFKIKSEREPVRDVQVLQMIQRSPTLSTRRISTRLGVPRTTVWRTLRAEGLRPFHLQKVQHLKPEDFCRRLNFCRWIIANPGLQILFTDESTFMRDGIINTRNKHLWAANNPHGTIEGNFQQRFSVNVWCGIIGNHLIGPHIFNGHLSGEMYCNFLENELPILLEDVPLAIRENMYFQQDGAPAHFHRMVVNYLNRNYPNRWIGRGGPYAWPARSPDLTPLDYYLWGHMKQLVYAEKMNNREELLQRIIHAADEIRANTQVLEKAVDSLSDRGRSCIQAAGGLFEQLL